MTTITEQNKLIAEFMGGLRREQCSDTTASRMKHHEMWIPSHGICRIDTIEIGRGKTLHYHTSWDWLMPVVEKIEGLGYATEIGFLPLGTTTRNEQIRWCEIQQQDNTNLFDPDYCKTISRGEGSTKKEATFDAVAQFITWYNENK